jgi:penicillin amidase
MSLFQQPARFFSALLCPFLRRLARASLPRYRGELTLRGLEKDVSVFWQGEGVPHVFAASEHDLFFAQGYLHAQERLWQMDLNRRFLSGRLAEIFGQFAVPWQELTSQFRGCDSVDADFFMRLIGIRRSALASLEILADDDRQRLEAYSAGVNRFIEQCGKRLPLEFRLLRYMPDPWRPEDTLTIGKGFAFLLSLALFTRLNAIAVAATLAGEPERLHDLYPSCHDGGFTITRARRDSTRNLWRFTAGTLAAGDWCPAGHGSNAWVIAPSRADAGGAILCNDPHLRMMLPSVWYFMHLQAAAAPSQSDGFEVWGASVPGCPGIQVGHNRSIAWGVTAALCDDVELYCERIHRLEPDRYQIDGRWFLMERQCEIIRVRGKSPVEKTLRWTRHGPVISDFNGRGSGPEVLSLRWTAHEAGRDLSGLYRLNCARNWDEFLEALSYLYAPTLNFVYADRLGNIGYSLAGKVPLRTGAPSVFPREGWRGENEWRGFVPFSDLPRLFNPCEGVIANANNQIVDGAFDHYLSGFFEPPYRVRRIHELLAASKTHSIEKIAAAQGDLVSLHAKELIASVSSELAAIRADESGLMAAADHLLGWDGHCGAESIAATIFHVFHHRLIKSLLVPTLGEEFFVTYVEIFNQSIMPIEKILANPASPWFAERPRAELVRSALADACAELTESLGPEQDSWQWGKLHTLTLNHAFGRIRLLRPFFSVGPFPSGGDNFTINVGFYRHSNPYQHTVGPSMRIIVETGPSLRSKFILPSGQSGHPFSRHYRDQTARWQNHDYIELGGADEQIRSRPLLLLRPAGVVSQNFSDK